MKIMFQKNKYYQYCYEYNKNGWSYILPMKENYFFSSDNVYIKDKDIFLILEIDEKPIEEFPNRVWAKILCKKYVGYIRLPTEGSNPDHWFKEVI